MFRWAWLIALTGCAQLFGLDETSKPGDAARPFASLQLEHVSIGRQVMRAPENVSTTMTAKYLVADAAQPEGILEVPATLMGTDTWIGDVTGATPVLFESPELPMTNLRLFDFPNEKLKANVIVFERPVHEAAPPPTTIAVNVTLNSAQAAETYQLFTIGAWTNIGIPAPGVGGTQLSTGATPLTLTVNNTPQRRLDKLTTSDVVYILRYNGQQLVGHYDVPPFDQTGTDTITGTMAATTLNQSLNVIVNQAQVASRLSTVRPAVGAPTMTWSLRASPALDFNLDNGPQLHAATVMAADPSTITASYGNPFSTLFKTVLLWTTGAQRTFTLPGTMAVATLRTGMFQRAEPAMGLPLTLPAGLPDRITANGMVLNTDGLMVMGPTTKPVDVTFENDAAGGTNTMYNLELFELTPNMTVATTTKIVTGSSVNARFAIPRKLFKAGSYYTLRAITFQGCFPMIAAGDLTQQSLPCAQAFVDSGVFQVTTP